jgi:hypothetical protein
MMKLLVSALLLLFCSNLVFCEDTDDDLLGAGSGSGLTPLNPDTSNLDFVNYRTVEVKFATKHKFSNQPTQDSYIAEVCDEVTFQLNAEGGSMPGAKHRPTMVNCDTLRGIDEVQSGAPKFKMQLKLPDSVDVDAYLDRVSKQSTFFTMLRKTSQDSNTEQISTTELQAYESERIPNINKDVSVQPTQSPGSPYQPGDNNLNNGGETKVVLHYPKVQNDFFRSPATLAAIVAAAVAGLFCTILCTVFVVYRMRKKDEGSYALDEPKHKYKHEIYIPSTKEFFA